VYLYSPLEGIYRTPKSLFIFDNNKLEGTVYPDTDADISVLVLHKNEGYQAALLDRRLAKSLFVRLYLLDGAGLKHFKPFIEEKDGDNYIKVFEIIWDPKEQ